MTAGRKVIDEMKNIYAWLDERIKSCAGPETCLGCGQCCEYETFGHRIFITTPEILYLKNAIAEDKIAGELEITPGQCPFLSNGKCSARDFRFGPCRIFYCKSPAGWQNDLTEEFLSRVKQLCKDKDIQYQYIDIPAAIVNFL